MPQLDLFEEDIRSWVAQGFKQEEIVRLINLQGHKASLRTLQRRMQEWGIQVNAKPLSEDTTKQLILQRYSHKKHSDTKIASTISSQVSTKVTAFQVKHLRLENGLPRRFNAGQEGAREAHNAQTAALLESLLDSKGRSWGYRWAWHHLRNQKGHRASRDFVASYQKARNPARVDARNVRNSNRPHNHRKNFVTPGPNYMWCVDGHDKLSLYGIQIYAAIDAYSRRLLWFYVGNANRSQFSVLKQYLDTVKTLGICPSLIRADFGAEAILMAAVQYCFFVQHEEEQHVQEGRAWTEQELAELNVRQTFVWGKSIRNIRIERAWGTLGETTTGKYHDLFAYIEQNRCFRDDLDCDKVCLLFTFMEMIRNEITEFVEDKNEYDQRPDYHRASVVPGPPNELWESGVDYSFEADEVILQEWWAQLEGRFDFNSYLTPATIQWCESTIISLGRPREASLAEFFTVDDKHYLPDWYRTFVALARSHFFSGQQPSLELAPRPFVDARKQLIEEICHEFGVDAEETGIARWRDDENGRMV